MSTVKSKKLQVGTDASASNNFTIYQPATPDGTLRIGVGNADSPTEVARVTSSGLADANGVQLNNTPLAVVKLNSFVSGISDAVWTKVPLNSIEIDTDLAFDTSGNKFTVPLGKGGKYMITASIGIDGLSNSNIARHLCSIYINGVGMSPRADINYDSGRIRFAFSNHSIIKNLNAGDYIEMYMWADLVSGTCNIASLNTYLQIHKLIA